ncbi:MAG: hypothetical protein J4F41_02610 [Alphaproteobacteria bacterium]|nr:hypothetical protein [Alphaproteobacteria bacterium]
MKPEAQSSSPSSPSSADTPVEKVAQVQPRCLFCGQPEQLVWVHGHGQCTHCGVNAMPCCDGAECHI